VLRALGRTGIADLVERLCAHARRFADRLGEIDGVEVLNDVVFTQVCFSVGDEERTERVIRALLEDGTAWVTGSRWRGRPVLRISVSNWSTSEEDVEATVQALARAVSAGRV
jgi:glutamate/tyrosine decarboxylase-like PLP-dependent enzyme